MLSAYGGQNIRLHIARFAHIPAQAYRLPRLKRRRSRSKLVKAGTVESCEGWSLGS